MFEINVFSVENITGYKFKDGINKCLLKLPGQRKPQWFDLEQLGMNAMEVMLHYAEHQKGTVASSRVFYSINKLFAFNWVLH